MSNNFLKGEKKIGNGIKNNSPQKSKNNLYKSIKIYFNSKEIKINKMGFLIRTFISII